MTNVSIERPGAGTLGRTEVSAGGGTLGRTEADR